mgnify:FL=1|tara:strand:- start:932 stop:1237 length:306 start_codon:yes stop_codon:yes gene_type:complete
MAIYKHIILRVNKPNISKVIGDVIDSLSIDTFEGAEVNALQKDYVKVIADISQELNEELIAGIKRYKKPNTDDPFYIQLLTTGTVSANEATLINYIELANA